MLVSCADGPAGFVGVDYGPRLRIRPDRSHVRAGERVDVFAWTGAGPIHHDHDSRRERRAGAFLYKRFRLTKTDTTDAEARGSACAHSVGSAADGHAQGPRCGPAHVSGVRVPCADGPAGFVGVDYGPRLRIRPDRGHVGTCTLAGAFFDSWLARAVLPTFVAFELVSYISVWSFVVVRLVA